MEQPTGDWICDCKKSEIRWISPERPHPGIDGPGWFCAGCLRQFVPGSAYWPLFKSMADHHGLTLLDSELEDICRVVIAMRLPIGVHPKT